MKLFLSFFSILFACFAACAVPDEPEITPDQIAQSLVKPLIVAQDRAILTQVRRQLSSYDLDVPTRKAVSGLAENEQFLRFVEEKGGDWGKASLGEQTQYVYRYLQTQTNLTPECVAWFGLTMDLAAPWQTAIGSYKELAKKRSGDFLPKYLMLIRPLKHPEEAEAWMTMLKETYAAAKTPEERVQCLLPIARRALELEDLRGQKQLLALGKWLDELEKTEKGERLPIVKELNGFRFFIAYAQRDFAKAAELADSPRLQPARPVLLALSGKFDEARKGLDKLKSDASSPLAKADLDRFEFYIESLSERKR